MTHSVPKDKTMSLDELIERLTKLRDEGHDRKGNTPISIQIPYPKGVGCFDVPIINIIDSNYLMTLVPDSNASIHCFNGECGSPEFKGVISPEKEED